MKPTYVKIQLFDPLTDEEFPVSEGIEVEIVRIESWNPTVGFDSLRLTPDHATRLFSANNPSYRAGRDHYIRVGFAKPNFSKSSGRLLAPGEVGEKFRPVFLPARIPYWDTGWRWNYRKNEHFDKNGPIKGTAPADPLVIKIPLREFYIVGHRGAPYHFPENTIASFKKALDLGANAFEFDLCLTKDDRIIVFHDAEPVKLPPHLDRTLFEPLPYELISPTFERENGSTFVGWQKWNGNRFENQSRIQLRSFNQFDIISLTLEEVRRYYHYAPVDGREHAIPTLDEFLDFVKEEIHHVRLLFFDIKNPAEEDDSTLFARYGSLIADTLKRHTALPAHLVVCNPNKTILAHIKASILASGEDRCEFAFDASGGLSSLLSIEESRLRRIPQPFRALVDFFTSTKNNALNVAREMGNTVVSIGTLARPGGIDEIMEAVIDRDYDASSSISTVIHWTLNDPGQMLKSVNYGVNAILTDRPDELRTLLSRLKVKIV